jgi:hypothetical protein
MPYTACVHATGTIGQGVVGGQGKQFDETIDNPLHGKSTVIE